MRLGHRVLARRGGHNEQAGARPIRFGATLETLALVRPELRRHPRWMGQTRHALPNDDAASDCAHDLVGLMRAALPSARVEHIVLSGFDSRGRLLFLDSIGRGSRGAVPVDGAALFALLATPGLTAIVLAHNHPSGDPTPSLGDIALTARIAQIARFARIALTDHLIFGHERHASFRALSLL
ncbi:hypothetical protein FSZ31_10015 [Sphingorhabdus soli]|uniref:MPN domain-containing protein n=2 Tax=Flavisphingopyxis soli TaxID=2601267 RepID=A0A5C6UBM9_9SPHN|nr:hypothetical protein FSZ31_10015 [Sphingorhabdus soli]